MDDTRKIQQNCNQVVCNKEKNLLPRQIEPFFRPGDFYWGKGVGEIVALLANNEF